MIFYVLRVNRGGEIVTRSDTSVRGLWNYKNQQILPAAQFRPGPDME